MKPDFISARTLIGHEYLELRNFTQAIHSYHKGTTLDPNDCRAWFGLGKIYNIIYFILYNIFQDKHMISRKCIRLRFDII